MKFYTVSLTQQYILIAIETECFFYLLYITFVRNNTFSSKDIKSESILFSSILPVLTLCSKLHDTVVVSVTMCNNLCRQLK